MSASIRGHQAQVKLNKNGQTTGIVNITKFSANQDASFSRSEYVGQKFKEGDVDYSGWSGNLETEVKDKKVDELIDALVTSNLAGVGADEVTIVDTEYYPDGSSASYVYFDIQFKMSKDVGGSSAKVTKRLEWQAAGRLAL